MKDILTDIVNHGGTPYYVGGCVRDKILGLESKDVDVEVYGISYGELSDILLKHGKVSLVGKSFGVIKFTDKDGNDYDFSLPREENSVGVGHKDFNVNVSSSLTVKEAAKRRDFTFNAISEDMDGNIVDPYNGVSDLENGILKHTSPQFAEDPLRVLRGFQFMSRFNLKTIDKETVHLCNSLKTSFSSLPKERIYQEFYKWATKSKNPAKGLMFLKVVGWLELFPELDNIYGLEQDPIYHPEGDVFIHTQHVCNSMNDICEREKIYGDDRAVLMFAALLHDVGKAKTTVVENGRIKSPGHAEAGVELANDFLNRIGCFPSLIERILPLVKEHMAHCSIEKVTERIVRRLSNRIGKSTIRELVLLMEADHSGRPPLPKKVPNKAKEILELSIDLCIDKGKPNPIVRGRHLIDLGFTPGVRMGELLRDLFELQLDGKFSSIEEGLDIVRNIGVE